MSNKYQKYVKLGELQWELRQHIVNTIKIGTLYEWCFNLKRKHRKYSNPFKNGRINLPDGDVFKLFNYKYPRYCHKCLCAIKDEDFFVFKQDKHKQVNSYHKECFKRGR